MKILQFSKKTPVPPKDGEAIAIHQLSEGFVSNNCDLHVYSLLTDKHKKSNDQNLYLDGVQYSFTKIDTTIYYPYLLKNIFFSNKPYIVKRFEDNKVEKKLIKLLKNEQFDIVHLEGCFLGNYIPLIRKHSNAKISLRAHNVESKIWERLAEQEKGLKKWYLQNVMIPRFKNFESKIAKEVDCIIPISKVDEAYFIKNADKKPTLTIPVSYKIKSFNDNLPNQFNVGFIGGLDWKPNQEGVRWFLKNVWKEFVIQRPKSIFNLAGRNFPKKYYNLQDTNLYIYGEIESAEGFTLGNSLMIAPILSGSGMRVKIIEALALGRTVLSTSIGAEGINYENNKNIFIADTPDEWISILVKLSENKQILIDTGRAGQELIKRDHNINKLGTQLVDFYAKKLE
ncbi:MAG: glycosyltransferase involved in cell wall biosynthesis [Planctomycetota bacterium]|jgi:glycosyltransferase involved in cell wall biosynthesis